MPYFPLNWIDIAIAAVLIIAVAFGFFHGLLRLLFACAAGYVAFILAAQYFHVLGIWLSGFFPNASDVALDSVSFAIIFLVSLVGLNGVGFTAYKSTRIGRIGILDQFAGSFTGFLLGFALISICLIALNFAMKVPWPGLDGVRRSIADAAATSSLVPMFLASIPPIAETVRPWLPTELPSIFYL